MKIKTRLISAAAALSMAAGVIPASAAYTDVSYDTYCYEAINRLQDLGMVDGYEDGSFNPWGSLTRAEFAKLIVSVIDKEDEALAGGYASAYPDVAQGNWAAPYIQYCTKQGILKGYVDGTFAPGSRITYAEAVSVMVRAMGYSEQDVGYYWPNNFTAKAASLGIADGLSIGANDYINRAQMAVMVDNMLFADVNTNYQSTSTSTSKTSGGQSGTASSTYSQSQSGAASQYTTASGSGGAQTTQTTQTTSSGFAYTKSNGATFLEALGYTILEDATVLSTAANDETLNWNEIKLTDSSIYEYRTQNETYEPISVLEKAVIDEDGYLVAVKGNLKGDEGVSKFSSLGYTVLNNCYVIASSSDDRNLGASEVRTSYGVYTAQDTDILSSTGECGTVLLNRDKKIISFTTYPVDYAEYVISNVSSDGVSYVYDNQEQKLDIANDFPIYVDYGTKKGFGSVTKDFVAGAELTMYIDNGTPVYGVLDTNAGYSILNDCFIVATKAEDKALASDEIRTSNGTYKVKDNNILAQAGSMGTVVINSSNKIEQFAPTELGATEVVVNSVSGNEVEYIKDDGSKNTFKFDNTFVAYLDYVKSTYATVKSEITVGTGLTFYGTPENGWEFVVIDTADDVDPIMATRDYSDSDTTFEGYTLDMSKLTVYRAGVAATIGDIEKYDVVYYNPRTNIMDVYTRKVTGIYADAFPNKAYVTSVEVAGQTYEIGTREATNKLDASAGSYQIGERVTLLLGNEGQVVFAVDVDSQNYLNYGVVLDTYSETISSGENKGKTQIKAKMFMSDGSTYEYVTDKNYSNYKGDLVKLVFNDDNDVVSLSKCTKDNSVYGEIDKVNRTIGTNNFLKNGSIIQLVSNEDGQEAVAELIDFDTMDVEKINSTSVLATVTENAFGDIGILFVEKVTDSGYTYGVMRSSSGKLSEYGGSITYKIFADGKVGSYTSTSSYAYGSGSPVAFKANTAGMITEMNRLYLYGSGTLNAIESGRIKVGNTIYKMDANVLICKEDVTKTDMETLSIEDLQSADNIRSVKIYSDKSQATGGTIKVVIVTMK